MLVSVMERQENILPEITSEEDLLDDSLTGTLHEIDFRELEVHKAIGKGSFGVVRKALWRGVVVAVKIVETDTELTAFQNEIRQLSRIEHENIIHMHGVAASPYTRLLVMEYADGGSLYDFLHCHPFLTYNLSHALSWLLQCAKAIDYLHSYQPKPIVHRDLKPLNMLLTKERKLLKVCDFGTACVLKSAMTDNRGSIAWMAPEVMKGESYDQKCDVYSWGLILWEVLTRRIPFEEWGLPIRIACQVIKNIRPPPIQGCPRPLQNLITSCWSDSHTSRPSMQRVLEVITPLYRVLTGGDEPVCYSSYSEESFTESFTSPINYPESSSGDQTSRDVSELPSTSNTNDLPLSQSYCSPFSTQSSSTPSHLVNKETTPEEPTLIGSPTHSLPVSVSSKLPVMNPNSPKMQREGTNFHPISFSPFQNVKAKFERKCWPPPPQRPMSNLSALPRTTESSLEYTTEGPSSIFTPCSIVIPNSEPMERTDVIIAPVCDVPSESANNPFYSSVSPGISSHQINQQNGEVSSVSPLQNLCLSPLSKITGLPATTEITAPEKNSVLDATSTSPRFAHHREGNLPHQQSVPSTINVTSATPHASNDSLDQAAGSSSEIVSPIGSFDAGAVPRRRHLIAHPMAPLRRRSAEVPDKPLPSKNEGHKRSSSFGSASLIGFEPLISGEVAQPVTSSTDASLRSLAGQSPAYSAGEQGALQCYDRPSGPYSFSRVHPNIKSSQHQPPTMPPFTYSPTNPNSGTGTGREEPDKDDLGDFWEVLDNELKPLMPLPNVPLSQQVFQQHKELARELLVQQEESVYLERQKKNLLSSIQKQDQNHKACQQRYNEKIMQLQNKNEGLMRDHLKLSQQIAEIKRKRQASQAQPQPASSSTTRPSSFTHNISSMQQNHRPHIHCDPHHHPLNPSSHHPVPPTPHAHTGNLICADPHCHIRQQHHPRPPSNMPPHHQPSSYSHLRNQ